MTFARRTGRATSRLLAVVLSLLAGLGLSPRLQAPAQGCRAGAHVCCCAPTGQDACACAGEQGPAAQFASLAACGDPADAPWRALAGTPGLAPEAIPLLLTLLPIGGPFPAGAPAPDTGAPAPSSPPPRPAFLSYDA